MIMQVSWDNFLIDLYTVEYIVGSNTADGLQSVWPIIATHQQLI